ncbi:MAG: DUF2723 domain-containing protein [Bacteroidales bacterium]|nr:DUF2723 domain-containing protein [Bacteroidales bacterium]
MDRSVSWWDCGEFISTGWKLQVGHPPGAPTYQLLSHLMMLLSGGNLMRVAFWSNMLSVVTAALTVGLLYWIIEMLMPVHDEGDEKADKVHWGAVAGALCYAFCHTAWFSAVESEVYATAMFFCALLVWLMLRWERKGDAKRLVLVGLLLGLGVGVHLMVMLTAPFILFLFVRNKGFKTRRWPQLTLICGLFFVVGLSVYAIVPIRAAANPPINEGNPSTVEAFRAYVKRDQYAKAPLWPRMWREKDSNNWNRWAGSGNGVVANMRYYFTYQLGYMYGRYIVDNFIGRRNDHWRCTVLFVLPLLLALVGIKTMWRRRRSDFWGVGLIFLFGGVILNLYLNHPCYEPRERDYAYVLSFFAVAVWIGVGAEYIGSELNIKKMRWLTALVVVLAPTTMAVGNWTDHDRHNSHAVHDIAMAHLQSCDQGAVLFTYADNDTFPLWYLQQVENQRPDITIYNISIIGIPAFEYLLNGYINTRPVYLSEYAQNRFADMFEGHLRCEGYTWRVLIDTTQVANVEPLQRHVADSVKWHIVRSEYLSPVSRQLIRRWQSNTGHTPTPWLYELKKKE